MQKIGVTIVQGTDSHYEFGKKTGLNLKNVPLMEHYTKQQHKEQKRHTVHLPTAKKLFMTYSPAVWEEMNGLSEGLEMPLADVVHLFGGYQMDWKKSGCSAFMQNGVYARNYDYHPKTYEGRFVIWTPTKGFSHIGFAQRIIGRMDGMNEHGLAVGYHFVNRLHAGDGLLCTTITRLILETCKSTKDAIHLLKELPHRHSFNYSMLDRSGHAAVVEASPRNVIVRNKSDYWCTNHFETAEMIPENQRHLAHSLQRKETLKTLYEKTNRPYDIYKAFNDPEYGVFQTDYHNWSGTLHSAIYDTTHKKIYVGVGRSKEPFIMNMNDYLLGQKLYVTKLKGTLFTKLSLPIHLQP
jgi:predicted choloylglycine hydrolase